MVGWIANYFKKGYTMLKILSAILEKVDNWYRLTGFHGTKNSDGNSIYKIIFPKHIEGYKIIKVKKELWMFKVGVREEPRQIWEYKQPGELVSAVIWSEHQYTLRSRSTILTNHCPRSRISISCSKVKKKEQAKVVTTTCSWVQGSEQSVHNA